MTIYFFDKHFNIISTPPIHEVIVYDDKRILNGIHSASLTCIYRPEVEQAFYFGSKDPDDPGNFLLFRVSSRKKYDGKIDLIGVGIFFYELQGEITRDIRPRGVPAWNALQRILVDSIWQPGINRSTKSGAGSFYYCSKLSAFQEFLDLWEVEFRTRLVFSMGKIKGRYIDLYDNVSADYGKRYEYGDKLISVEAETRNDHLYTGILPLGKGEEVGEGYGRKIRITDVVWSKENGDPMDKPSGYDILVDPDAITKYGKRITVVDFPEQDDRRKLIKDAYEELQRLNRPQVEFRSSAIDSGKVELGEMVTIIRRDLGIAYKTRVFEIERNLLNDSVKDFRFGDRVLKTQSQRIKATEKTIQKNEEEAAELYNKSREALDTIEETLGQELEELNTELTDNMRDVEEAMRLADIKVEDYYRDAKKKVEETYYNEDAYEYRLKLGNAYGLPAGTYSFDAPIDRNPTKVTYYGAGKILIANRRKADGEWDWNTFVTGDGLGADVVDANSIQAGAVSSSAIQADAVTSDKIMAGAITAGKIGAWAVTANKLAAGAVTANAIQSGAITSDKILAGSITTDKFNAYNVYSLNGTFTGTIRANDGYFKGEVNASRGSFGSLTVSNSRTQGLYYGGLNNCIGSVLNLGGSAKSLSGSITNMAGSLNQTTGIHAGGTTGKHTGSVNSSRIEGSLYGATGSARLTQSSLDGDFSGTAKTNGSSNIDGSLQQTRGTHSGSIQSQSGTIGGQSFRSSGSSVYIGGVQCAVLNSTQAISGAKGNFSGQLSAFKLVANYITSNTQVVVTSDERTKTNLEKVNTGLISELYDLPIYTFRRKNSQTVSIGINATQLQNKKQSELKKYIVSKDQFGYLGADYLSLASLCVAALQDINYRLKNLEEKND